MAERTVEYSRTTQVQIILSQYVGVNGRLFGGILMQWIDITAAVVARRHSGYDVATAAVLDLEFKRSAKIDDTIVLDAYMCYAGRTSMDVCVDTYVESLNGDRLLVNTAHIIMVALDAQGNPACVPGLSVSTKEEKERFEAARQRAQTRSAKRAQ